LALTSLAKFATQGRVAHATEARPCSFPVGGPPTPAIHRANVRVGHTA
jgi:hypothetical protein